MEVPKLERTMRVGVLTLVAAIGATGVASAADYRPLSEVGYRPAPVKRVLVRETRRVHCYACADLPWGGLRKSYAAQLPWGGLKTPCPLSRPVSRLVLARKG